MKPTTPAPFAKRKLRASSEGCWLGIGSSGPSSASIRRRVSAEGTNCESATCAVSPPPSGISSMKRTCQSPSRARRARSTTSPSL